MKIAVVGSRGFDGAEKLCDILDHYIDQITVLITAVPKALTVWQKNGQRPKIFL